MKLVWGGKMRPERDIMNPEREVGGSATGKQKRTGNAGSPWRRPSLQLSVAFREKVVGLRICRMSS